MTVMILTRTMFNPHGSQILVLERNLHDTSLHALRKKVEWLVTKARNVSRCTATWRTVFQRRSASGVCSWCDFYTPYNPQSEISQSRCTLHMLSLLTLLCNGISESGHSSCNQQAASGTNWKAICASLQNCAPPLKKARN